MGKESNKYEKQTLVPFSLSDIYNFITIFAIMSEKEKRWFDSIAGQINKKTGSKYNSSVI